MQSQRFLAFRFIDCNRAFSVVTTNLQLQPDKKKYTLHRLWSKSEMIVSSQVVTGLKMASNDMWKMFYLFICSFSFNQKIKIKHM